MQEWDQHWALEQSDVGQAPECSLYLTLELGMEEATVLKEMVRQLQASLVTTTFNQNPTQCSTVKHR